MRYVAPHNSTPTEEVPQPPYVDGNKAAGVKGSLVPAAAIEHGMREILAVITAAGLTPSGADLTQLLQAINIIAAGAGAPPASFALNPIYPEITVNGGIASISGSTGQVVLATGQTWVHRGGTLYNSSDLSAPTRTLSTVASKTYHMRWRYNGGSPTLALYDLADVGYNPGAVAEGNPQFDTTYDDMLLALVVTNASNVPTITALKNKARLSAMLSDSTSSGITGTGSPAWSYAKTFTATLNWSRNPEVATAMANLKSPTVTGVGLQGSANLTTVSTSRYACLVSVTSDFDAAQASTVATYQLSAAA